MNLTNDEILSIIDNFEKETKALKREVLKYCWYMRGGITYDDAMLLSFEERNIIADIIKSNLETTKETGQPFF